MEYETYHRLLEMTPERKEKLSHVANETITFLTDTHGLDYMECYAVLEALRQSLMSACDIESVQKIYLNGDHSQA